MTADDTELEGRTPQAGGSAGAAGAKRERSRLRNVFALRNWRVRRRLLAVILIPVVAAAALGGLRIVSSWDSARDYGRVEQLARLGEEDTALVHELQLERDLVAGYIARGRSGDASRIDTQQQRVDARIDSVLEQARAVDESYAGVLREKVTAMRNRLAGLDAVRSTASQTKLPAARAITSYTHVISALLDVTVEIAQSSESSKLQSRVRALHALARAKEQVSRQRALVYVALEEGKVRARLHESVLEADAAQRSAISDFTATASVPQQQRFEDTVTGSAVDRAARLEAKVRAQAGAGGGGGSLGVQPRTWFHTASQKIDLMRGVEKHLARSVESHSQALQADARVGALRDAGVVLLVVVLALGIALAVARSLARPLQRLRSSALDVAEQRLPDVVHQLQQSDGRHADVAVERTSLDSDDEVGQVARAFDEVHAEAVRLATEQAALRGNVNAMFVNLSRRSQGLVERQLRLIDELENGEQDPEQLASLFKLDHLATRMRRHGENLLVLAGEEPARRRHQPVPLLDVLRAAVSEVEQYDRVELRTPPAAEIGGRAVNDVVHLLAELLENATSYSPHDATVVVTSARLDDDRVMVQVSDSGIGMSADELGVANERLATQPVVDVSVSRRMGLFVVGRLAWRHGIRVQLRPSETGGVTALVMLSESMVGVPAQSPPAPESARAPAAVDAAQHPPEVAPQPPEATPQSPPEHARQPASQRGPDPRAAAPVTHVTRVPSRPVYGESGATDPGMSPVQPHPAPERSSGQGAGRHRPPESPAPVEQSGAGAGGDTARHRNGLRGAASGDREVTDTGSIFEDVGSAVTAERTAPLPIFDEIQSEWFRQRTGRGSAERGSTQPRSTADPLSSPAWSRAQRHAYQEGQSAVAREAPTRQAPPASGAEPVPTADESSWQSPGDEAWRTAERTISAPSSSGVTAAGLPKRVPGHNFVPGSAGDSEPGSGTGAGETTRSAEDVGNRLSSYHQGIRRGRHAGRHAASDEPAVSDRQREQENA